MFYMHKIRVGVIRGGPSNEYEVSLRTGANVIDHLSKELGDKYMLRDILIDKSGKWFVHGIHTAPHTALSHLDVAFNALHGKYGEDGKIQHIFESHGIPFTGSGSFPSALGMNKVLAKEIYKKEKIKCPQSRLLDSLSDISKEAHKVFNAFPLPVVVKPASSGSSLGVTLVKDFSSFDKAVRDAYEHSGSVFVEEFINGKEASCGVIEGYRDQEHYSLPPVEIRPHNKKFYDFEAKFEDKSDEIVPGNFTDDEKKQIEAISIQAHKALGLRHYSRSDFIIHPKRGIFILETNSQPELSQDSLINKSLRAIGAPLYHFLDHIIQLAISQK
jgi:D-alanine-D-alanine ligase